MIKPKTAVILAAGMGTRLRPLTEKTHKCLVEVNGKIILVNSLVALQDNKIERVILAVGYLKEQIKQFLAGNFSRLKIDFAENDLFQTTNNSYSLWLALQGVSEPLIILEGDVFFEKEMLSDFLSSQRENETLLEKYNFLFDGTFVKMEKNGLISQWVHKKDRPDNFILEDKHKTINIHKISERFLKDYLNPELDWEVNEGGGEEPIETIFKRIINKGGQIYGFANKNRKWFEIDDENDLKIAKEIFK